MAHSRDEKNAPEGAAEAYAELRLVIDNMPSLVAYVDSDRNYRLINKAYQDFFGVDEEELIGKHVLEGVGPDVYEILCPYIDTVLTGQRTGYEEHYKDAEGAEHHLSARIIPYITSTGAQNGYLVMVEDVTEQKNLQLEIEESNRTLERRVAERTRELEIQRAKAEALASHDPLTGVLNRRSFFEQADVELSRAKRGSLPLSIAIMDVDHFKNINDTFGHDVGDDVLKDLARAVEKLLRPQDLLGRIGGEEFAIVASEINSEDAIELFERLRAELSSRTAGHEHVSYTASFGVSMFDLDSDTVSTALKRADIALYEAKEAGRNKVVLR